MASDAFQARPSTAAALRTHSFRITILLILTLRLGLAAEPGRAAQSASSTGSPANINPEVRAAYRAGSVAATANDFKTAEVEFEKVVRLAPQIEEGHGALGAVLMRQGKLPAAIKELQKAVELKPSDESAKINLGLAYQQSGANKEAIASFRGVEGGMHSTP
ncbi:MAG: tetratricopeptide repeat protein, partial [Candidatus Acidiferrum sp.]